MGYHLNRLDEPVLIAVSKPLLTEFGIHHRLESCALLWMVGILDSYPDDTSGQWFRHAFSGCDADIVLYLMSCVRQKRIVPRFLCLVNDPSILPHATSVAKPPKMSPLPVGLVIVRLNQRAACVSFMRVCIPVNSIHCIFWLLTICDF